MRTQRSIANLPKRIFHPEMVYCPQCKTRLRRHSTLSRKTVITLQGPLYAVHCGYRCPKNICTAAKVVHRSVLADALALPGFTFGLDVIALVAEKN